MTAAGLLRRRRAPLNCAPIRHVHVADPSIGAVVARAEQSDECVKQQDFARPAAALIRLGPHRPEYAEFGAIGCRVFDDDESQRIAQIWVAEKRMQFFLFPAERDSKTGAVLAFPGWRYVHQEGWVGAVTEHNGVCFMAALQGREKDLEPYLSGPKQ